MKPRETMLRYIQLMVLAFCLFISLFSAVKFSIDMQVVIGISILIYFVVVFAVIEGIISIEKDIDLIEKDVEEIKKKLTREKP